MTRFEPARALRGELRAPIPHHASVGTAEQLPPAVEAVPRLACRLRQLQAPVVGATVGVAFDALYYLERAAQAQCIAMATGKPLRLVRTEVAERTRAEFAQFRPVYAERHFEALKRQLDRDDPDYVQ